MKNKAIDLEFKFMDNKNISTILVHDNFKNYHVLKFKQSCEEISNSLKKGEYKTDCDTGESKERYTKHK